MAGNDPEVHGASVHRVWAHVQRTLAPEREWMLGTSCVPLFWLIGPYYQSCIYRVGLLVLHLSLGFVDINFGHFYSACIIWLYGKMGIWLIFLGS